MYRALKVAQHGGDRKSETVPIKTDNIRLDDGHGTSRAYTLDRLKREAPELFESVVAGELSANAAAIKAGFRQPLDKVEALIRDDPVTLEMWETAITGKNGAHASVSPSDNVTRKRERGNAKGYTLRKLKRDAPELFEQVAAGKLSANAAAIKAGFRRPPGTPFER